MKVKCEINMRVQFVLIVYVFLCYTNES
ncbi:hypothetical protein NC652_031363 [Populus alba x Populus x berolinensis]|uniref:Uncharacterized protein n=1 Tax=Populus alba x Populus x berolinensis TaxID=444605 RepID=A0AAD6Q119_9ROSI|nr:hypothetical protein NC652_031363 [Populus alba x Populus x berolinensis]KAJ6975234.1 hypothetical protein NC653_031171 [Populus alba x Populus x berolinensis]